MNLLHWMTGKAVTPAARRQSHRLSPEDRNRRRIIWIVTLFLISIELPETATYISYFKPAVLKNTYNWFILPGFNRVQAEYWYYKDTAVALSQITRMIAVTKIAVAYSTTVFLASVLILSYLIFDLFMYWLNFNEWPTVYEFFILFIYIVGRSLIKPFKPDAYAQIKSLF